MIKNIENYDNEELINLVNQITNELVNRSEVSNRIEIREITDFQEYPDSFLFDVESFEDEFFTVILDKSHVLELKNRLNKTNYV